jgi:hypothetical protein
MRKIEQQLTELLKKNRRNNGRAGGFDKDFMQKPASMSFKK